MEKKILISLFVVVVSLLFITEVLAMPPPGPDCHIKGIIKSVESLDAWQHECITQGTACPTGILSQSARYALEISVEEISTINPYGNTNVTCEEYLEGLNMESQTYYLHKSLVHMGDFFEGG